MSNYKKKYKLEIDTISLVLSHNKYYPSITLSLFKVHHSIKFGRLAHRKQRAASTAFQLPFFFLSIQENSFCYLKGCQLSWSCLGALQAQIITNSLSLMSSLSTPSFISSVGGASNMFSSRSLASSSGYLNGLTW